MVKSKKCNKCNKYRDLSVFYGSKTGKYGVDSVCNICRRLAFALWRQENPELSRIKDRKYRESNANKVNQAKKKWEIRNPDKVYLAKKRWRDNNPELCRAYDRKPRSRRDRIVRQQTPSWANHDRIKATYSECARITRKTGVIHHVDHIIPLKGRNISGLHCHENLQIIPALDNLRKNNKC